MLRGEPKCGVSIILSIHHLCMVCMESISTIEFSIGNVLHVLPVGHQFFLHLIMSQCTFTTHDVNSKMPIDLTDEEIQALRYAAGYIPRSLMKKILKSSCPHQQKKDLLLCLDDLLSDGTEETSVSTEWITAVNHGGLLFVNNMTFELFYSMEVEFRHFVGTDGINSCTVERMEKTITFCFVGAFSALRGTKNAVLCFYL